MPFRQATTTAVALPAAQLTGPANAPYPDAATTFITYTTVAFDSGGFTTGSAPFDRLNVVPGIYQVSYYSPNNTNVDCLFTLNRFAAEVDQGQDLLLTPGVFSLALGSSYNTASGLIEITLASGTDNLRMQVEVFSAGPFTPAPAQNFGFGLVQVR